METNLQGNRGCPVCLRQTGRHPRHHVQISPASETTGEIVGKYHRRPSFAKYLKRMALKGRPDTLGQLELAPYEE